MDVEGSMAEEAVVDHQPVQTVEETPVAVHQPDQGNIQAAEKTVAVATWKCKIAKFLMINVLSSTRIYYSIKFLKANY